MSPDAARSVAEPLLVLAISLAALCAGDRAFSGSLMVVSTAMFLKEQRTRTRRREVWLDAQDRQIEDEELSAVASGANTLGASRGFAIPGLQRLPTSSRREIAARLRPVGDPVLAPPKARAIRTTPKPELAAPDAPPVAAPVYPPVDRPAAAAVSLERGISPVFLTVELVPLPPAHVARAAGAGHGSVPSARDPAVQESGGAVNGEAVPESVVGEEGLGKEPLPEEEAVVRGDALQREVAREPSADEGTARSRSSFGADTDAYREAAPPRDSDEEAWVDAFATFRSRARRSRDAASEFDPSDIERN